MAMESESLRSQLAGELSLSLVHFFWPFFFTVRILTKKHLAFLTAGLERKLQVSADTAEQLSKDKTKLQNDMSDMMKESGDSSVQLTKMNQDLTEKERYQYFDTLHHLLLLRPLDKMA